MQQKLAHVLEWNNGPNNFGALFREEVFSPNSKFEKEHSSPASKQEKESEPVVLPSRRERKREV